MYLLILILFLHGANPVVRVIPAPNQELCEQAIDPILAAVNKVGSLPDPDGAITGTPGTYTIDDEQGRCVGPFTPNLHA
jgi:hypothetical protein